jgi:hypothetical protein
MTALNQFGDFINLASEVPANRVNIEARGGIMIREKLEPLKRAGSSFNQNGRDLYGSTFISKSLPQLSERVEGDGE